jgi:sugar phosphate isomerase/epimerase
MGAWNYALSSADRAPDTAPILLRGDICRNLRTTAALGYQGLEVHTREDVRLDYDAIAATSAACGVSLAAIVTGRLNTQGGVSLIDDRPYIIHAAMEGMHNYIKMAALLKTNLIVGWIKGLIPEGMDPRPYLERLAGNLTMVCKEAGEHGVKVLVEVLNRYEANIFTTAKETIDFLNTWEVPNCYIHLDTFHMNIGETNPVEAIHACGGRLGYFHVADNTRLHPGSGTLDFRSYFSALEAIGYSGFVSVECFPRPDGETAAHRALEYLKRCETDIKVER